MENTFEKVIAHYAAHWGIAPDIHIWEQGPVHKLYSQFRVLEFEPTAASGMWKYAIVFLSGEEGPDAMELFLFSARQDHSLIELLFAVAFYHQNTCRLGLNDSVNFGRSWQDNSICTHGFISLPYIGGPGLETLSLPQGEMKCYWLIPVTEQEIAFRKARGTEALENLFEEAQLDYANPSRSSLA
jgi:hypothetical protein